jgi:hypothetical protein
MSVSSYGVYGLPESTCWSVPWVLAVCALDVEVWDDDFGKCTRVDGKHPSSDYSFLEACLS